MHKENHRSLSILQVSPGDGPGGAERVALDLHGAYRSLGHTAWLAVGRRTSSEQGVLPIPNDARRSAWARGWLNMARQVGHSDDSGVQSFLRRTLKAVAEPSRYLRIGLGHEDFDYPATSGIATLPPQKPSILHAHNLHGSYFDLRVIPALSAQIPTVVTLHDNWMMTGHCAHSFNCERWKTGCGRCPDLAIYPSIRRDATAYNWRRKERIYNRSRLFVATPCHWLMAKVQDSILKRGVVGSRVIPNGVDLEIFKPGDRAEARKRLGWPQDATILLYAGRGLRNSPWRDYRLLVAALAAISQGRAARETIFMALGESLPEDSIEGVRIRFLPFEQDAGRLPLYYRASDAYVHPSRVDTFPTSILEALACGVPVIATAVGGIPEQVRSLGTDPQAPGVKGHPFESATGMLTADGDAASLTRSLVRLLENRHLQSRLAENARRDACARFDIRKQADAYLAWFTEILAQPMLENEPQQ